RPRLRVRAGGRHRAARDPVPRRSHGGDGMKWVTREHPKTDRVACPWLIRKFIDPDAEIVYLPRDEVLAYAEREAATSFDAPGATYTHRGDKCSFETLIDDYRIEDRKSTRLNSSHEWISYAVFCL